MYDATVIRRVLRTRNLSLDQLDFLLWLIVNGWVYSDQLQLMPPEPVRHERETILAQAFVSFPREIEPGRFAFDTVPIGCIEVEFERWKLEREQGGSA